MAKLWCITSYRVTRAKGYLWRMSNPYDCLYHCLGGSNTYRVWNFAWGEDPDEPI